MTEKSEDTRNRYHIIARHHKAPVTVDADRHEQEKDKMIFYVGDSLISEVRDVISWKIIGKTKEWDW